MTYKAGSFAHYSGACSNPGRSGSRGSLSSIFSSNLLRQSSGICKPIWARRISRCSGAVFTADFRKSLTLLISAHFRALSVPTFGVIVELRCINASTNKSIPGGSQHDDEIPSSHNWHYRKGDFWGLCSCMTGTLLVYGKVNLNETTLDNTWRAVGLIGSKSLEIGADSTCENRRDAQYANSRDVQQLLSGDNHGDTPGDNSDSLTTIYWGIPRQFPKTQK